MKRGEVWTLQDRNYASKARPVVIIQTDDNTFESVILCLLTTFESENIPMRIKITPTEENGLEKISYVMTEKIVTVEKIMLGKRIGKLAENEMSHIARNLAKLLEIHKTDIED
jgi:mRNA interferase MazF